ncbi:hypothetical protein [Microbulbifer sp. TYP-18]|uniref:hypothetical protein n=1 Tax=Microbulbifer sp. TYP-18 TaxID=3230024 RepID=UPI0034C64835
MRFAAVFLFLFSTPALANDIKLVCTISGKYFGRENTQEYQITFNENEKRACTHYPCMRYSTYKANKAITFAAYMNLETTNTVGSWSNEIIELKQRSINTLTYTLDRTSGTLRFVFVDSGFEVEADMKGPCEVVRKLKYEAQPEF